MGPLELYHYVLWELSDARSRDWTLLASPLPITLITLGYLYFVTKCGPRFMKDRPPYKLQTFIRLYNVFQIVANGIVVYCILESGWLKKYWFTCTAYDYTMSPENMKFLEIIWYIMCLKIFDYIETCLFVVRKKQQQISFLHLYHHVSTVYYSWISFKYFLTASTMVLPLINCAVHVIMYTYYLLSTFGPNVQKMISPLKRMITITQMVQFWFLIIYSLKAFTPQCRHMMVAAIITIVNLLINFVLFFNFYQKNYVQKEKAT